MLVKGGLLICSAYASEALRVHTWNKALMMAPPPLTTLTKEALLIHRLTEGPLQSPVYLFSFFPSF